MDNYEVLRATDEWQRAGAYFVRIYGMNKAHHISLRDEFDDYDTYGTKYIILLDDGYPFATCRFYEKNKTSVVLGRVVVIPEYRGKNLGAKTMIEAEKWIKELGYKKIIIDSRVEVVGFYEKLGCKHVCDTVFKCGVFGCVKMEKEL